MKRVVFLSLLVLFSACSLENSNDKKVLSVDMPKTGDPAVDSARQYLPEYDLQVFGLSSSEDLLVSDLNVSFYGPLRDRRAVRGKKITVNASPRYGTKFEKLYVVYGFSPDTLNYSIEMNTNAYGSFSIDMNISLGAPEKIYFVVKDQNGNSYFDKCGGLFVVPVYDSILSYGYGNDYSSRDTAFWLTLNYSGKDLSTNTVLHYGWNNWQNISDTKMTMYDDYASITMPVSHQAFYLDFAVNNNGVWDNNSGADYHQSVKPFVFLYTSRVNADNKWVNMTYANSTLDGDLFIRHGYDGWKNFEDSELFANYYNGSFLGFWSASFPVPASADVLDFAFFDEHNNWENNYGMDWHYDVSYVKY